MQDYLGHRDARHTVHYTRVSGRRSGAVCTKVRVLGKQIVSLARLDRLGTLTNRNWGFPRLLSLRRRRQGIQGGRGAKPVARREQRRRLRIFHQNGSAAQSFDSILEDKVKVFPPGCAAGNTSLHHASEAIGSFGLEYLDRRLPDVLRPGFGASSTRP
jgi:hypothetical protein